MQNFPFLTCVAEGDMGKLCHSGYGNGIIIGNIHFRFTEKCIYPLYARNGCLDVLDFHADAVNRSEEARYIGYHGGGSPRAH